MNNSIAAIILTFNEEKHIARCIKSIKDVCNEIWVIDSFSTDRTCEIAAKLGAKVRQHAWLNYSSQFNFAIYNCDIQAEWIWRIDADEFLNGNIGISVKNALARCDKDVNGVYVRRRIDFMGRPLMHGGWYPSYHLKIFRKWHGECENRWMDEHIRLFDGNSIVVDDGEQVDANLNDLTWWTNKHNGYSTREMVDILIAEYGIGNADIGIKAKLFGKEDQHKRWLKQKYAKAPLFIRPFFNFFYRYILKRGFLDGKEGFIWHVLQGFWYRMLIDAKIYELKKRFGFNDERIKEYIKATYLK